MQMFKHRDEFINPDKVAEYIEVDEKAKKFRKRYKIWAMKDGQYAVVTEHIGDKFAVDRVFDLENAISAKKRSQELLNEYLEKTTFSAKFYKNSLILSLMLWTGACVYAAIIKEQWGFGIWIGLLICAIVMWAAVSAWYGSVSHEETTRLELMATAKTQEEHDDYFHEVGQATSVLTETKIPESGQPQSRTESETI